MPANARKNRRSSSPSRRQATGSLEVKVPDLRWQCDTAVLKFRCTEDIEPPSGFVGQDRAAAALEVGLGVSRPGFNIFVTGQTGTGRAPVVMAHLQQTVARLREAGLPGRAADWCYVFNFDKHEQPNALRLEAGQGPVFAGRVTEVLETLTRDLRNAFQSEEYQAETKRLTDGASDRRQQVLAETERFAIERGFAIQMSPIGVSIVPLAGGKPMEHAQFLALDPAQRADLDRRRQEVTEHVEKAMQRVHAIESERQQAARDFTQKVAENTIRFPFEAIAGHYAGNGEVLGFLERLKEYTLGNIPVFLADGGGQEGPAPAQAPRIVQDPHLPFRVNVFVSHAERDGAPIVQENNPTYPNMFGLIERRPYLGTYVTDHTMLRAGAIVRASGGYLIVPARDALRQPGVWEALKRALRGGVVRPEDPGEVMMPGLFPQGLRPEAIPIDTKVIMVGDDELYHLLAAFDEDFWEIFKVRADFDFRMENTAQNVHASAALVCGMVKRHQLKHVDRSGVAEIVEYSSRIAGDRTKLSTRFGYIRDLLIEADYWARQDGDELIRDTHVRRALEHRIYRTSRISDAIRELMVKGVLRVDLSGSKVGQINGLAVYDLGDVAFGKPSRITARTFMGRQGVVNIEREARLSGSTHDKGVLILGGLLGARYAQDAPLSLNVSLAFEQSYEGVEGDSASAAELFAIISSLSGAPLRQDIAVTGSINQMGQVQAIGGVNQKIEGFFDVCREARALGSAGVVIPKSNVANLGLRNDVVDAARDGRFHVYAIDDVDEGIELLTGRPAGAPDASGRYPEGTVNSLVVARLRKLAEGMRAFSGPASPQAGPGS
jgi:lon-related putative ATP-dependent protease